MLSQTLWPLMHNMSLDKALVEELILGESGRDGRGSVYDFLVISHQAFKLTFFFKKKTQRACLAVAGTSSFSILFYSLAVPSWLVWVSTSDYARYLAYPENTRLGMWGAGESIKAIFETAGTAPPFSCDSPVA